MASKNKQKKNNNAYMVNGVKCTAKLKRIAFYNGSQRRKEKAIPID